MITKRVRLFNFFFFLLFLIVFIRKIIFIFINFEQTIYSNYKISNILFKNIFLKSVCFWKSTFTVPNTLVILHFRLIFRTTNHYSFCKCNCCDDYFFIWLWLSPIRFVWITAVCWWNISGTFKTVCKRKSLVYSALHTNSISLISHQYVTRFETHNSGWL